MGAELLAADAVVDIDDLKDFARADELLRSR
jgi:hypothetical protein